jgi:hypothetical protein
VRKPVIAIHVSVCADIRSKKSWLNPIHTFFLHPFYIFHLGAQTSNNKSEVLLAAQVEALSQLDLSTQVGT